MSNPEVVIVGAGPYGLSVAAHLRHRGIGFRIFGVPMQNWQQAMPRKMFLKSDGAGSSLSDPEGTTTLAHYCSSKGLSYGDHGVPIALQTFVEYALSFQRELVPDLEECRVLELAGLPDRFELQFDSGERVRARKVVLAVGTTYFAHMPAPLANLPRELVTHSRDHSDFADFADRDVVVIGGGQSALETAALLNEQGARVQVLVRAPEVAWNPPPTQPSPLRKPFELQTALGTGGKAWFYCHLQSVFQHLPLGWRTKIVERALGPAGAWWLKDRVLGRFPVRSGHEVQEAREAGGRVRLSVVCPDGRRIKICADHVIAATGYKVDLRSLPFLHADISRRLRRESGAPALSRDFQSSTPGLYFTGLASATRFGPSMRFVFGAEFAARRIAESLSGCGSAAAHSTISIKKETGSSLQRPVAPLALAPKKLQISRKPGALPAVLVLNFGEYPFHQGSLGIIRSLGSLGIPVFTIQRNGFIPSGASRYLSGKFMWSADAKCSSEFLEGMAGIAKSLGRETVLVPADDLSAIMIAEHAQNLPTEFTSIRPPPTLPRTVANKRSLYELCQRLGVATPSAKFPNSQEELLDLAQHTPLPVVIKVVEPWLAPNGIKSTTIISIRKNLIEYCHKFARPGPATSLMFQEMIPSSLSEDWFVHGYFDRHSQPLAVFTGLKMRSYPAYAGPTTLARSLCNEVLRDQAIDLLKATGYQGIMDLDYKFDRRDARYKLLDFNPRVGAQFRLFKTEDGTDVVRALYGNLTGQLSRIGPQIDGRTFVAEIHDMLASRAYWRSGALSIRGWWNSLRRIDETAWFAWDDPLPFLVMCLHLPFRAGLRTLNLALGHADAKEASDPTRQVEPL